MSGAPADSRPAPRSSTALYSGLLLLGLCALVASPGVSALPVPTATAAAASPSVPAGGSVAGTDAIAAASASLEGSGGPFAAGGACSVVGTSVSCPVAAAPHPLSSNSTPPASWDDLTQYAGAAPSPRWIAAMVYDPVDHYVLLFGGYGSSGADGDTWAFVNNTWNQLSPGTAPTGRYGAALAWDYTDNYAVLFGGTLYGANAFNDTWTYVHGAWTNITGTTNQTPGGRWREAMTWDPVDGYVLMFGGTNAAATPYGDTWSFVDGNWTLRTVTGSPPARYRASMAWDDADGYAVLFGGCTTSSCPDSGTWTYVNNTWSSLSLTTHPNARVYFGITYSTSYDHILLFGGSSSGSTNSPLSDTWQFANGTWKSLTVNLTRSPSARAYLIMAFDPIDNYSIIFGGQWSNGTFIDETWALGASILGSMAVRPGTIDVGQSTEIDATPFSYSDYVSYNYTQLPAGCTSQNVSTLSCTPSAVGTYPLAVVLNDSAGSPVTFTGLLTVNPDPVGSGFTVNRSTVTRGAPVQFSVAATGGTGSYSYRYYGLPPGCGTSNVYNLTCTPSGSAAGAYVITARVTDQANFGINQTLTLMVNPTPSFRSVLVKPTVVDVGQSYAVWANLTPGSGTGPYSYVYSGLPAGCASVDAATVSCVAQSVTAAFIQVMVTDSFGFTSVGTTNLTVNAAPAIASSGIAPTPIDVGTPITLWVNGTGGTGALTYTYAGAPPGCSLGNRSTITCTPSSPGNYTISATATDAVGVSATAQLTLVVNPGYTAGVLSASPSSLDVGQNLTLTFATTGGTGPYTYTWSGLPTGCPTSSSAPTISCQPRSSGTFAATVTGTDAWHAVVSGGVQLIINPAPTVSGFTASSNPATQGTVVDLTVAVAGGSGPFSYAYAHLPPGCTTTNSSLLHCTPSSTGTYNVSVTVTDALGATTSGSLLLTVNSASTSALGLSGTTLYLIIGVVVVLVAIAAVVLMRRRRAPPAAEPVDEPAELGDDSTTYGSSPPS
jgi:PKD domain/Galactose oxidase, central domain